MLFNSPNIITFEKVNFILREYKYFVIELGMAKGFKFIKDSVRSADLKFMYQIVAPKRGIIS